MACRRPLRAHTTTKPGGSPIKARLKALGGIIIGGMIGALAGGAVIGMVAASVITNGAIGTLGTVGIGGILAATTLYGMHAGKEKFGHIGTATCSGGAWDSKYA